MNEGHNVTRFILPSSLFVVPVKKLLYFGKRQLIGLTFVAYLDAAIIDLNNGLFHPILLKKPDDLLFIIIFYLSCRSKLFKEGRGKIVVM